ncbi:MAG TPA: VTT domain-containing protein, partial [Natrialbaceae archaeon]|nr:VTT domain-containing protein [Natrialbaceae archaeon]
LTTVPPFLAVRWFDRGVDVGRVGEASEQFFATTGDFRGVMAARIAPVPADVVTCAAGLGDVRLRTVIAGTVVGEIPWTVVAIAVGTSADRLAAGRMTTIGLPVTLAMLALAVILLAGPARRLLQDRGEPSSGKN